LFGGCWFLFGSGLAKVVEVGYWDGGRNGGLFVGYDVRWAIERREGKNGRSQSRAESGGLVREQLFEMVGCSMVGVEVSSSKVAWGK
jgi:hypothetical protein